MTPDPFGDVVRLSSPADIIALIPYMLGFHPADSLVIVAMRARRPVLNVRVDLPGPGPGRPSAVEVRDLLRQVGRMVTDQAADAAILVGYGPRARVAPMLKRASALLTRRGVPLFDVLRVTNGRYWSYQCANKACCPPEGTPFDIASSPVAVTAAVAGLVALPDREALVSQVDPVPPEAQLDMWDAVGRADERLLALADSADLADDPVGALRDAADAALDAALAECRAGAALRDDDLAWLCVLASLLPVGERLWQRVLDASADLSTHRVLWLDALRRAPMDLVPAVGCLASFAALQDGDGALGAAALDRVLAVDADYPPARVLDAAFAAGRRPAALNPLELSDPHR
ncbi:hypothetical protein GCM10009682_49080 [Luedemannella flava]|uniref:DUF4192 domain-containing protein n=1 Tax=Luedemannella flava TaxID=349316 RepID=A0ABN2MH47_9ACTN